eukprot:3941089-Rhodomonas_salina.4
MVHPSIHPRFIPPARSPSSTVMCEGEGDLGETAKEPQGKVDRNTLLYRIQNNGPNNSVIR